MIIDTSASTYSEHPGWFELGTTMASTLSEPGSGIEHDMLHKSRMRLFPSALLDHDANADTDNLC